MNVTQADIDEVVLYLDRKNVKKQCQRCGFSGFEFAGWSTMRLMARRADPACDLVEAQTVVMGCTACGAIEQYLWNRLKV